MFAALTGLFFWMLNMAYYTTVPQTYSGGPYDGSPSDGNPAVSMMGVQAIETGYCDCRGPDYPCVFSLSPIGLARSICISDTFETR